MQQYFVCCFPPFVCIFMWIMFEIETTIVYSMCILWLNSRVSLYINILLTINVCSFRVCVYVFRVYNGMYNNTYMLGTEHEYFFEEEYVNAQCLKKFVLKLCICNMHIIWKWNTCQIMQNTTSGGVRERGTNTNKNCLRLFEFIRQKMPTCWTCSSMNIHGYTRFRIRNKFELILHLLISILFF